MLNTCKSNGKENFGSWTSGERVSKTQITNPRDRDNKSKDLLIPSGVVEPHGFIIKGNLLIMLSPEAGSAAD